MKKLLVLISLFSVSCAFGMNPNASAGKAEADDGDQATAAARASASASAAATAPIDHDKTGEKTVSLTFADSKLDDIDEASPFLKVKYARCSGTFADLLDDLIGNPAQQIIPLEISATEYEMITPYWHLVYEISISSNDIDALDKSKAKLTKQLQHITDKEKLGTIIRVADYLNIQPLIECGLQAVHDQLVAEIDLNNFRNEKELKEYNPYNLNHNLNRQLATLLVEPAAQFSARGLTMPWTITCNFTSYNYSSHQVEAEFSPDGKTVITISDNNTAQLWNTSSGQLLRTFEYVAGAQFIPNSSKILATVPNNTIEVWDTEGNCLKVFNDTREGAISPDGKTLFLYGTNDEKLVNIETGKILYRFDEPVHGAMFSPDSKTIIVVQQDTTKLLNQNGKVLASFEDEYYAQFSPNGKTVLLVGNNNIHTLVNLSTGTILHTFEEDISDIRFLNEDLLLTGSWEEEYQQKILDIRGNYIRTFENVSIAEFSPVRNLLLIMLYGEDNTAQICDLTGNCLHIFKDVVNARFSPDGRLLLIIKQDGTAQLCNLKENCLYTLENDNYINLNLDEIEFSPDGAYLLINCPFSTTPKLVDTKTGKRIARLEGHLEKPDGFCFSPNNKIILTTCRDDQTVKFWDLKGNCIHTLCDATGWVKKTQKLKTNCTLPQALFLRYALQKNGIDAERSCSHRQCNQLIYNTFDPEMQQFIKPLLKKENCEHCIANKQKIRSAIKCGATASATAVLGVLTYKSINNQQAIRDNAHLVFRTLQNTQRNLVLHDLLPHLDNFRALISRLSTPVVNTAALQQAIRDNAHLVFRTLQNTQRNLVIHDLLPHLDNFRALISRLSTPVVDTAALDPRVQACASVSFTLSIATAAYTYKWYRGNN